MLDVHLCKMFLYILYGVVKSQPFVKYMGDQKICVMAVCVKLKIKSRIFFSFLKPLSYKV